MLEAQRAIGSAIARWVFVRANARIIEYRMRVRSSATGRKLEPKVMS
jgi:hypothetical protein